MKQNVHWNLAARISVGLPLVGTGVQNALFISSAGTPYFSFSPRSRLRTLPARLLLLLADLLRLPVRFNEAFFLSVPPLEGSSVCDWDIWESDRCRLALLPTSLSTRTESRFCPPSPS